MPRAANFALTRENVHATIFNEHNVMKQATPRKRVNRPTQAGRIAANKRKLARFKRILQEHLPELRERYAVKSLGVFGSFARGQARTHSDLDLLVEFHSAPSLFKFIDLQEYLAALLKVQVDLVPRSALKPTIGQRILADLSLI